MCRVLDPDSPLHWSLCLHLIHPPSRRKWSFLKENLDTSSSCKNLSVPFQNFIPQRSKFLTSVTKPSVVWFQPLFPASPSCCSQLPPNAQNPHSDPAKWLAVLWIGSQSFPLPFAHTIPSAMTVSPQVGLPGGWTRPLYIQAKLHLWGPPWHRHSSSKLLPHLDHVRAQWHALIMALSSLTLQISILCTATSLSTLQSRCSVSIFRVNKSVRITFSPNSRC